MMSPKITITIHFFHEYKEGERKTGENEKIRKKKERKKERTPQNTTNQNFHKQYSSYNDTSNRKAKYT